MRFVHDVLNIENSVYAKNQICTYPTYHTNQAVSIRSLRRRPYRMKPTAVGFISLTTVIISPLDLNCNWSRFMTWALVHHMQWLLTELQYIWVSLWYIWTPTFANSYKKYSWQRADIVITLHWSRYSTITLLALIATFDQSVLSIIRRN